MYHINDNTSMQTKHSVHLTYSRPSHLVKGSVEVDLGI